MLSAPRADGCVVGRLRLRGAAADPLAARLRLEALLATVSPPATIPAPAILCVRHVSDPLPGALPLGGHPLRPPARWERALSEALDGVARRALRPARGAVPADADAVVFADAAELLACLARDLVAGLAGLRWWWRALYRDADLCRVLVEEWLRTPESVPPVLERLASEGTASILLETLGDATCHALSRAVAARHGLPALAAAIDAPSTAVSPAHEDPNPLERWAREATSPAGTVEARTLLSLALGVRRAPAALRTARLAEQVAAWRATDPAPRGRPGLAEPSIEPAAEAPRHAGPTKPPSNLSEVASAPAAAPHRTSPASQRAGRAGPPPPATARPGETLAAPPITPAQAPPAQARAKGLAAHQPTFVPAEPEGTAGAAPAERMAPAPLAPPPPARRNPPPPSARTPVAVLGELPLFVPAVDTELGGLFFLVNVGLSLGLYGDFTTPLEPGIDLPLWDFVELLGKRLLKEKLEDDPVWALLAELAGRDPGTPPGEGCSPPAEWSLPSGFGAPEAPPRDCCAVSGRDVRPLDAWMTWLSGHVHARLVRALALEDPTTLAPVLLRHRARVRAGETRVDVHLALAELPLAVRLAGLDRDPGWLPAGGRSLYFHFE